MNHEDRAAEDRGDHNDGEVVIKHDIKMRAGYLYERAPRGAVVETLDLADSTHLKATTAGRYASLELTLGPFQAHRVALFVD